jgi:hypothetical protein
LQEKYTNICKSEIPHIIDLNQVWERVKAQNKNRCIRLTKSPHARITRRFLRSIPNPEITFQATVNLNFGEDGGAADGVLREEDYLRIIEFKGDYDEVDKGIGQLLKYRTLFIQRYGASLDTVKLGLVCSGITPAQHAVCQDLDIKLWLFGHVTTNTTVNDLHLQHPDVTPWDIWVAKNDMEFGSNRRRIRTLPGACFQISTIHQEDIFDKQEQFQIPMLSIPEQTTLSSITQKTPRYMTDRQKKPEGIQISFFDVSFEDRKILDQNNEWVPDKEYSLTGTTG